jgi:hypothetical protein
VSGLVVDTDGNLFVIRNGVSGIVEYGPAGRALRVLDDKRWPAGPEAPAPAIESDATGGLFVDAYEHARHRILRYARTGGLVASFDEGMEDGLHGLAYNPSIDRLYIINANSDVTPNTARVRVLAPPPPETVPVLPLLVWLTEW